MSLCGISEGVNVPSPLSCQRSPLWEAWCLHGGLKRPPLFSGQVEGAEYEELAALHESVYQQSVSWFASLQDHMKKQILSHFGSMPEREPEPQVGFPPFSHNAALSLGTVMRSYSGGKSSSTALYAIVIISQLVC